VLTLTETAVEVIHNLTSRPDMPADTGLRITPQTDDGGAPAFALTLSQGPDPDDNVIEAQDARVFLEPGVAQQLADKVLDAQINEQGEIAFLVSPQAPPAS
jgi:iron-sulfur cluster assembly protein